MSIQVSPPVILPDPSLRKKIEELSGQKASLCFQCEKCSNGCPVTSAMDILPHRAMRLLNLGQLDKLLRSDTIWVCAGCETCSTRCPNGVDIAHIMDSLRQLAQREGVKVTQKDTPLFNAEFLASVKQYGRVNELRMIANYTFKSKGLRGLLQQARTGLSMVMKGKLKLLPHSLRGNHEVRAIFKQTEKRAE